MKHFSVLSAALLATALATPALADYAQHPLAAEVIDSLSAEGIDRQRVENLLKSAVRQEKILEAIARPAERTHTWGSYSKIFVQDDRARQGVAFWQEHRAVLEQVEAEYGVPQTMILAILGVETRYGRHKGSWRAIDALATLGFDYPPRADFFRGQLKELFRLEQKAGIDIASVTGSYAGALGYPQFIPSSYIHYAVDQDGDGKIDLLDNPADAIGSIANYFKVHGWQPGLPIAARARVKGDAWRQLLQTRGKPETTLGAVQAAGATPLACSESSWCLGTLPAETPVALIELEGDHGREYWITSQNFYVITRYNHSYLYALAATHLKARIEQLGGAKP